MKKKKLMFILGIVIIIAGLGIALYPVITNVIHKHQQAEMLKQVKSDILKQAQANKANSSTGEKPADLNIDIENIDYENREEEEVDNPIFFFSEEEYLASQGQTANAATGTPAGSPASADATAAPTEEGAKDLIANVSTPTPSPTPLPHRDEVEYNTSRLYGQDIVGIIEIPNIDLIYAIVEGVEDWNIGVAIGHFKSTVMPGEVGNCGLAGHNGGRYGRYFGDIDELNYNDEILITTLDGLVYTYKVQQKFIVEPTEVSILDDVDSTSRVLTLVTCTNHGKQRLIVRAYCTEGPSFYTGEE
ncbi:MAG: sortase [Lachnospiraceae bacterium]|nr:sortase [Lachnospiraceae bacterium]